MKALPQAHRGLSTWGAVRRWEQDTRTHLRRRHRLWLHGWGIGAIVVLAMWGVAHLQMVAGSGSLALRYLVTLGAGYLVFLLVLRWWGGMLVGEEGGDPGVDVPVGGGSRDAGGAPAESASALRSGGGGDFGGGGAEASFEVAADAPSVVGEAAGGVFEAAGAADEGAVVVVPVLAVFAAGFFALVGFGWMLLLFFGFEVLLAVAVEIAFGYVSARTAVRVAREGWLHAAVRLTWKPLLGALACAVLLGAVIDRALPDARSLPHAVQLLRQG